MVCAAKFFARSSMMTARHASYRLILIKLRLTGIEAQMPGTTHAKNHGIVRKPEEGLQYPRSDCVATMTSAISKTNVRMARMLIK